MKDLFTISEFAKLRNVNINSLRYYEKLGVLRPVHVDPATGYRYYGPEQLAILDAILFCVNVGIPLKELSDYVDGDACMYHDKLFETGKLLAEQRIQDIQLGLKKIEYTLRYWKANQSYAGAEGLYTRPIIRRRLITAPYSEALTDSRAIEVASAALYNRAQEEGLSPVFPAGLVVRKSEGLWSVRLFFEIVDQEKDAQGMRSVQEGTFLCRQMEDDPLPHLDAVLSETYGDCADRDIFVANMFQDHYQIGRKKCELQMQVSSALQQGCERT